MSFAAITSRKRFARVELAKMSLSSSDRVKRLRQAGQFAGAANSVIIKTRGRFNEEGHVVGSRGVRTCGRARVCGRYAGQGCQSTSRGAEPVGYCIWHCVDHGLRAVRRFAVKPQAGG